MAAKVAGWCVVKEEDEEVSRVVKMVFAESKSWFFSHEHLDGRPVGYAEGVSEALRSWDEEDDVPSTWV